MGAKIGARIAAGIPLTDEEWGYLKSYGKLFLTPG